MLSQYLRIVWARKWLVLLLFVLVSAAGIGITFILPRQYTAETSLIVEMRIDPVLGALAPALAAPSYMATQIEILKSDRVAARAVKLLGVERSPEAVAPAKQSASFLDEQTKTLRSNLEEAQTRLSKYQQSKGIVVSDERLDQENARYSGLISQLALAQISVVAVS